MEIQISILEISPRLKYLKVEPFDAYSIVFIGDNIIKKVYDLEKAILNKELIVLQLKEYNPNQLINFILIRNKINIVGLGELNVINQIKWFSIKELKDILTLDKSNGFMTPKNMVKNNCSYKPDIMNIFKTINNINNINNVNNNSSINNVDNNENNINILNINNIKLKLKIIIYKDNKKNAQIYIKKNNLLNKKKGKLSLLSLMNINNNNNIQTSKINTINFNNFIDGENNENNNYNNNENINFYNYKSSSQKNLKNSFYKSPISNTCDVSNEISNSRSNQTVGNTKLTIKNNNSKSKYNGSNKKLGKKSKQNKKKNFFKLYTINNDEQNKLKIHNIYQNKEKDIPYNVNTFNFNERSNKDLFFTVEPNEEILHKSKHQLNNLKKINSCHNSKNHQNKNKIYKNNSLKNLKKMKNPISNINPYANKGKSMYNKMASNLQIMHNSNKGNSSNNLKTQTLFEHRDDSKNSKSSKMMYYNNNNSKEDKIQNVNSKIMNKHSFVAEKFRTLELSLKKNIFVSKENKNYEDNDNSTLNYYDKIKNDFISFYNDDYIKLIKGNFSQFELNLFIEKIIELYKAYKLKYNSLYSNFVEYKKFIFLYQYKFLCLSKKYSKLRNKILFLESTKNKQEIYRKELNDFLLKTNKIFSSGEFNKIFKNLYSLNDLIFNKDYNYDNGNEIKKKKLFFIFEEICDKNQMNLNSLAKKYYHDLKKCAIFNNQLSEIKIPNYDNDCSN